MHWSYRLAQWVIALHRAKHRVPWFGMIRAILSGPVPRSVWRERLRYGCYQCPVFNKELLTCRGAVPLVAHLGCDCFVPFSALTAEPYAGGCWGRAAIGNGFGWGTYRFKSRWDRLTSPIRFLIRK